VQALIDGTAQEASVRLSSTYPKLEYVVQYQEWDLDFALRLLEHEGIYFWFEHTLTGHVMHIVDDPEAHEAVHGDPVVRAQLGEGDVGAQQVYDLRFSTHVVPDTHLARDWNWLTPNTPIEAAHTAGGAPRFARMGYPAGAGDVERARRLARTRQLAAAVPRYRLEGLTRSVRMIAGRTFTLVEARPEEINGDYLIVHVTHEMGEGPEGHDLVRFEALPRSVEYRPAQRAPRPRIDGRDTAVVTGPRDQEIHVDAFGRVKVQFYWDRAGTHDEHSSCWLRVVQPNTAGSMYLPRIGWEASIAYADGDPDRPIVTHQHFNAERPSHYELPPALPRSSWRSQSSPGGRGFNEVRFDDTPLAMELFMHAQRDLHVRVGHDREQTVGVNSTETVHGRLSTSVAGDETIAVAIDQFTRAHDEMTLTTGGDKTVTVTHLDSWKVQDDYTLTYGADRRETTCGPYVAVANAIAHTVNGRRTRTVGGAQLITCLGAFTEAVGADRTETIGGASITLVRGAFTEQIEGTKNLTVDRSMWRSHGSWATQGASVAIEVSGALAESVAGAFGCAGALVSVRADNELRVRASGSELHLGGSVLDLDAAHLTAQAASIRLVGQVEMIGPETPEEPEPPEPGPADDWLEISLLDQDGRPAGDREYLVRLPDGTERRGRLGSNGRARISGVAPGTAEVSFPETAS
jgi:type VI secretion system secreted protein VgrG